MAEPTARATRFDDLFPWLLHWSIEDERIGAIARYSRNDLRHPICHFIEVSGVDAHQPASAVHLNPGAVKLAFNGCFPQLVETLGDPFRCRCEHRRHRSEDLKTDGL